MSICEYMYLSIVQHPLYQNSLPYLGKDVEQWISILEKDVKNWPLFLIKQLRNICLKLDWVEGFQRLGEVINQDQFDILWSFKKIDLTYSPLPYIIHYGAEKCWDVYKTKCDPKVFLVAFWSNTSHEKIVKPEKEKMLIKLINEIKNLQNMIQITLPVEQLYKNSVYPLNEKTEAFFQHIIDCQNKKIWELFPSQYVTLLWNKYYKTTTILDSKYIDSSFIKAPENLLKLWNFLDNKDQISLHHTIWKHPFFEKIVSERQKKILTEKIDESVFKKLELNNFSIKKI